MVFVLKTLVWFHMRASATWAFYLFFIWNDKTWGISKKTQIFFMYIWVCKVCVSIFVTLPSLWSELLDCGVSMCVTQLNLLKRGCHTLVRPATFGSPGPITHLPVFSVVSQVLGAVGMPLHGSPWWCLFEFLWWPGWACFFFFFFPPIFMYFFVQTVLWMSSHFFFSVYLWKCDFLMNRHFIFGEIHLTILLVLFYC